MGDDMIYSLANPIQFEDNDVKIDLRLNFYYPKKTEQLIIIQYLTSIPVDYYGVLPCITVCRPTKHEVENYEQIALTSKLDWDPYGKGEILSKAEAHLIHIESVLE